MVLTQLQRIMEERKITVESLAAVSSVSCRTITSARKGRGMSLNTCKHIAKGLKINLEALK